MIELWKRSFQLFRSHISLWVPCSIAGILMLAFDRLDKFAIHSLLEFFSVGHSVLGGEVATGDLAQAQHRAMMVGSPLGALKDYLEIFLFVVALATTKNLVQMVLEDQWLDIIMALRRVLPRCREVLLFSLKYMAVMAALGGVIVLSSFALTSERFRELALSKVFFFVFGLIGECCLAWLLVPAAIRLLRPAGSPSIPTQERKMGTIFAVVTSAGSFALEILVRKAETVSLLDNQWERGAVAVVNTVIVNAPQVLLFIALALLAIGGFGEKASPTAQPEVSWSSRFSDSVRRAREWRNDSF